MQKDPGVVKDVMRTTAPSVPSGAPLGALVEVLLDNLEHRAVYVVDGAGKLVGVVSFRSVLRAVNARLGARAPGPMNLARYLGDLSNDRVDDFARSAVPVQADTPLEGALRIMETAKENDLPVVDGAGRLVGELAGVDVLRLARGVVHEGDRASRK